MARWSHRNLGKLRNGTIANPKRDTLMLLCHFFQVPPSYFFPDFPPDGASEVTGGDPIGAVMRVLDLPPEAKRALEAFLRAMQRTQPRDYRAGRRLTATVTPRCVVMRGDTMIRTSGGTRDRKSGAP